MLGERGVAYTFHDYKKAGVTSEKLNIWCTAKGWDVILNRAGATFKKLADEDKADLDQAKAVALMIAQPSMIKRPIVERGDAVIVGFKADEWASIFA